MKKLLMALVLAWILCPLANISLAEAKTPPANKKEIMNRFLEGTLDKGYVPAAFFMHFDANHKEGEAAVNAHLKYFLQTNQDILKVQFEQSMPRIANLDKQETWDKIVPPAQDFYRKTLEVIKGIHDVVGRDVYVLPTIYSPYQVARQSLREENIVKAAKERPDDLKRVLGYYADALLWLVKECKAIGIEGFYTTTQGGEMKFYEVPGFFETFIKPFDFRVMEACNEGTKLNILHICDWEGTFDDLTRFKDYPAQIVNTPINLNGTTFSVTDGVKLFGRPVLGGLDRHGVIVKGSEDEVAQTVREALRSAPKGKVMLGAECTVGGATMDNIHRAVATAHHKGE